MRLCAINSEKSNDPWDVNKANVNTEFMVFYIWFKLIGGREKKGDLII